MALFSKGWNCLTSHLAICGARNHRWGHRAPSRHARVLCWIQDRGRTNIFRLTSNFSQVCFRVTVVYGTCRGLLPVQGTVTNWLLLWASQVGAGGEGGGRGPPSASLPPWKEVTADLPPRGSFGGKTGGGGRKRGRRWKEKVNDEQKTKRKLVCHWL